MVENQNKSLRAKMSDYRVPQHNWNGIEMYFNHGIRAGSFLMSIFENDMISAVRKADHINKNYIKEIVQFVYECLPSECYGSVDAVNTFINSKSYNIGEKNI